MPRIVPGGTHYWVEDPKPETANPKLLFELGVHLPGFDGSVLIGLVNETGPQSCELQSKLLQGSYIGFRV